MLVAFGAEVGLRSGRGRCRRSRTPHWCTITLPTSFWLCISPLWPPLVASTRVQGPRGPGGNHPHHAAEPIVARGDETSSTRSGRQKSSRRAQVSSLSRSPPPGCSRPVERGRAGPTCATGSTGGRSEVGVHVAVGEVHVEARAQPGAQGEPCDPAHLLAFEEVHLPARAVSHEVGQDGVVAEPVRPVGWSSVEPPSSSKVER